MEVHDQKGFEEGLEQLAKQTGDRLPKTTMVMISTARTPTPVDMPYEPKKCDVYTTAPPAEWKRGEM